MKRQQLIKTNIPDAPGVYIFEDAKKRPLYIGRATSLKDRTLSYFVPDLIKTRGLRIIDMVTKAKSLRWMETASLLEAVILESNLIKKYQPYYNVDEKDDRSSMYVVITDELWPRVFLERARDFDMRLERGTLPYRVKKYFGPFVHIGIIKESLKILRRIFPFRDKRANDPRHEAFYRSLGISPSDIGNDDRADYNQTIKHLLMFFGGKKVQLQKQLLRHMNEQAKSLKFEKANQTKKLIYALDHIRDVSLIKHEISESKSGIRIEAYDVAHLGGKNVVGVMVVSQNGQLDRDQYRRFKISHEKNDDIAALVEILSRRLNHTEWQYPDLIVVDGGETHKHAVESVLQSRRIGIPVIAITKDEHHKASKLIGNADLIKKKTREVIALNAEAHRFAIAYHRRRRATMWK